MAKFKQNSYDYIIVDEFHHASSASYKKIIDYFKPKFFLGLTATPHRLDKKDVFQICDYNVPYQVDLFTAINRDWLVPFAYYGIYDDIVKYDNITFINGNYVDKELSKALSIELRSDLIYKQYMKHKRSCAIGFCVDINHAENMAEYFKKKNIKAATIHSDRSKTHVEERSEALRKLASGELEIIFAVDVLNEGVDVPNLNMLLFLRPTLSPTIFLQQLGRGLRHHKNKENLKVLDFIGNYRNVELLPFWLSGRTSDNTKGKKQIIRDLIEQKQIPVGCFIDFDLDIVDIFEKMIEAKVKIADRIKTLYFDCKSTVGHIPSRMELFESLDDVNYQNIKKASKQNPFRNYLIFISSVEEDYAPDHYIGSGAEKFINMIEKTQMQALYKIPIFMAFYNNGSIKSVIDRKAVEKEFYKFYQNKRHWRDLARYKTRSDFREWLPEDYWKVAQENPIHFLSETHSDVFKYDKDLREMSISLNLDNWLKDEFFIQQVKDSIEFRRAQFLDKTLN